MHLPQSTAITAPFWRGGADGKLGIARCAACGFFLHPPVPVCRKCLSEDIRIMAVSGRGRVVTFTINHHAWHPDLRVPYVIAVVELVEQPGLLLTTNIVDCAVSEVLVGQSVEVCFEAVEDIWLPKFRPATS